MSWSKCRFGADQTLINVKTIEKKNVLDPKLGFMKRKQISFWMYRLFQPSGVVNDWWYNLSFNFKKNISNNVSTNFKGFEIVRDSHQNTLLFETFFFSSLKNDVFMFSVKSFYFLFFSRFLHNNNLLNNLFFIHKKSVSSWKQWKLIARYILNLSMWNKTIFE